MRTIARIDIKNQDVIKGINLEGLRKIGNPENIVKEYYLNGIDEILIIDSVASLYGRNNLFNLIKDITKDIFIPVTLGGGIRSLKDIENALNSGSDKVAINSKALENPNFLSEAVANFGESTILVNIEAKKITENRWEPYKFCGREKTNLNLIDWINTIQDKGCGEILLTSIDKEGTETGFDIELISNVYKIIKKPLIVSGGCGNLSHVQAIKDKFKDISIGVASVLHYKTLKISEIKKIFL
ncbi:imidazole glycerol phosphate synthase cyclase subunit [Candidatus Pelagibacter sp.]|nr:imidazole glycerol phosphate synthase cyclase subunit [Candidatus Pelagibacter sp.]|tara:strand:+ start:3748 stop:4473 length:726 start_codon:yes stop_codon:yes gene_type:complete